MPAEIFVDTSGWGNLVDASQLFHLQAATCYRDARTSGRRFLTTNYVIAELIALLHSPIRLPRAQTVAFIDGLKFSPFVEIAHIDVRLDDNAWQLFKSRQDKDWSLVDCASFVLMKERGITEAMTPDHHFEQAGLVRLLK